MIKTVVILFNGVVTERKINVDSTLDHEFRFIKFIDRWKGKPYIDYHNQALLVNGKEGKRNHALVVGLIYTC